MNTKRTVAGKLWGPAKGHPQRMEGYILRSRQDRRPVGSLTDRLGLVVADFLPGTISPGADSLADRQHQITHAARVSERDLGGGFPKGTKGTTTSSAKAIRTNYQPVSQVATLSSVVVAALDDPTLSGKVDQATRAAVKDFILKGDRVLWFADLAFELDNWLKLKKEPGFGLFEWVAFDVVVSYMKEKRSRVLSQVDRFVIAFNSDDERRMSASDKASVCLKKLGPAIVDYMNRKRILILGDDVGAGRSGRYELEFPADGPVVWSEDVRRKLLGAFRSILRDELAPGIDRADKSLSRYETVLDGLAQSLTRLELRSATLAVTLAVRIDRALEDVAEIRKAVADMEADSRARRTADNNIDAKQNGANTNEQKVDVGDLSDIVPA